MLKPWNSGQPQNRISCSCNKPHLNYCWKSWVTEENCLQTFEVNDHQGISGAHILLFIFHVFVLCSSWIVTIKLKIAHSSLWNGKSKRHEHTLRKFWTTLLVLSETNASGMDSSYLIAKSRRSTELIMQMNLQVK